MAKLKPGEYPHYAICMFHEERICPSCHNCDKYDNQLVEYGIFKDDVAMCKKCDPYTGVDI